MLENLRNYRLILGSRSPRRRELLQMLRLPFHSVVISGIDETYPEDMPAAKVPLYLSGVKADAYIPTLKEDEIIITADTLVILGDRIFGKPKDAAEAHAMLRELSDNTHQVVSGVTIADTRHRTSFTASTDVTFGHLSDEDIEYYIENYRPFDKAGSYGIQEWIGAVAVSGIRGSYYNVMGLPVHRLYRELQSFC